MEIWIGPLAEDKGSFCLSRKPKLIEASIPSVPKEKGRGNFQGSQVCREAPQAGNEKRVYRFWNRGSRCLSCGSPGAAGLAPQSQKLKVPMDGTMVMASVPERTHGPRVFLRLVVALGDPGSWNNLRKRSPVETTIEFSTSLEDAASR